MNFFFQNQANIKKYISGFVLALSNDSHFAAGFAGVGTNFLLMCACGK